MKPTSASNSRTGMAGRQVDAVVVGASAGGVEALLKLFAELPAGFGLPLVAVLHVPDDRESLLAEVFGRRLPIPVREAQDKGPVERGTLYFAPPGYHLSIERGHNFSLSCEPPVHWSRPSIDVLLQSAADAYGERLAGIVLTGANEDGAAGLAAIGAAGGITIVQDPAEAAARTMPEAAIARRAPDYILALRDIRALLVQLDAP